MNHVAIASQQSVSKQVLVNKLVNNKLVNKKIALFPELSIVVKDFLFYDKVTQVSRNVKNELIARLDASFAPNAGHYVFTEGYGIILDSNFVIRYKHTTIQCIHSNSNIQFIACYHCGNFIQSNMAITPDNIRCRCGVVELFDYNEDEEDQEPEYNFGDEYEEYLNYLSQNNQEDEEYLNYLSQNNQDDEDDDEEHEYAAGVWYEPDEEDEEDYIGNAY